MNRGSDCLIRLMSFAGNQNSVAFFGFEQREPDRLAPVDFDLVLNAFHSFITLFNNGDWIFTAWVIRSYDRAVTFPNRHLSHSRPLCAIAFAATAKHDDQPSGCDFAGRLQNLLQRIVRMGVIHNDAKRLAGTDVFESSGHMAQLLDTTANGISRYGQSDSNADGRADIKQVGLTHQRRLYLELADWRFERGVGGFPPKLVAYRTDVGCNLHSIADDP